MNWVKIDQKYLDFLRSKDNRIPLDNYTTSLGEKKFKPFFFPLFKVEDVCFVTQISHAKERHKLLNENIDFYKINNSDGSLISVVNLNYMFPVKVNSVTIINNDNISDFKNFNNDTEKNKYLNLLGIEMRRVKEKKIQLKAKQLYVSFDIKTLPNNVKIRCVDFKKMIEYCNEYSKNEIYKKLQLKEEIIGQTFLHKNKEYTIMDSLANKSNKVCVCLQESESSNLYFEENFASYENFEIKLNKNVNDLADIYGNGNVLKVAMKENELNKLANKKLMTME